MLNSFSADSGSETYQSDGEGQSSRAIQERPDIEEDYDNFKTYFPDYDGKVEFEAYLSARIPSMFTPTPPALSMVKFTSFPTSLSALSPHSTISIAARLPHELFAHIFSMLSAMEPPTSTTIGWIRSATHVCRAWRAAALAHQLLWGVLTLYHPSERWTQMMLVRAAHGPLRVNVCIPGHGDENLRLARRALGFAATHLPRLLELRIAGEFMTPSITTLLTTPAPALVSLDIALDECGGLIPFKALSDAQLFLAGNAPALRELRVSADTRWFPWMSPVLRDLVSLEVMPEERPDWVLREGQLSVGAVLRALREMRSLERLVLELSFDPTIEDQEIVVLPRLEKLDLSGSWRCATVFLQGFSVPAHAKFRMRVTENWWRRMWMSPHLEAFFTALSSVRSSCSDEISSLTVSPAAPSLSSKAFAPIIFQVFRHYDASDCPWTILELPPMSELAWARSTSLLTAVVRALSPARLHKLRMLVRCTEDDWSAILDVAKDVEEIYATHTSGSTLCSVLCPKTSADEPPGVRIPAPQLRTLILRDLYLSSIYDPLLYKATRLPVPCAQLAACLAARTKAGSALTRLDITGCAHLTEQHVWDVEDAVPDIKVVCHLKRTHRCTLHCVFDCVC
ncbi:hypothetical protein FA95DRAFT_656721 [Auriscalpium vulgare]|uniref:Uncharacterized protein n=1 Tax=Auriscalpium vulgare TaxID=40419 RepID=A0ACB8RCE9_9AGAM|nr:hypothetical protein FA95DRAFT_656721 [Auriscalpium vulgare]